MKKKVLNKTSKEGTSRGYIKENKAKSKLYGVIKLIIFLALLLICFVIVNNIVKRKETYQKTADFFSQEEDFDVLFFGSSHVLNAVFPMKLWNDYGIISYNMGSHGESLQISYYNMLLALKETKPKLVVIDTYMLYNIEISQFKNLEGVHISLDAYPVSYTKYSLIKDLTNGNGLLEHEIEYLFNFSKYHSRWNELNKKDFQNINTYEKGAESRIAVATPYKMTDFELVDTYDKEETNNMQYLRKIIEYCQENDIEILVTYLPYPAADLYISMSKYVENICREYKVNYINFLSMKNIVNYDIDCYDQLDHLNPSGARKVTDYLGKYIIDNYNIPNQKENKSYSFWYKNYDKYIDLKISNLKNNANNLNNYLMLLYGEEDIKYEIKISSKRKIESGSTLQKLLENINNNYETDDATFTEKKGKTIKVTTWDNRNGKEIQTVWF